MAKHPLALAPKELRRTADASRFQFESTEELPAVQQIIGQPRGVRAIEFGIGIDSPGFNIYVLGPTGSGRTTAIKQFLEERAASAHVPLDWVYVYNFEVEHQPRAIEMAPGMGTQLREDMEKLIEVLRREIPNALQAEEFANAIEQLETDFGNRRGEVYQEISGQAAEKAFVIARTPSGLVIAPINAEGQILEPDTYQALPKEEYETREKDRLALEEELEKALRRVRDLDREHADARNKLERGAAAFVLVQHLGDLREKYEAVEEVVFYLNQVRDDVLEHLDDFKPQEEPAGDAPPMMIAAVGQDEDRFRRYKVNVLVDHSRSTGAPVILEELPSYANLVGRIEGQVQLGALITDFVGIKPGALHKANGGYLVLRARDVLSHPDAWDGLKRALLSSQIRIEESGFRTGLGVLTPQTIDPEPIPLDIKVVLLGDPGLYYALIAGDENFSDLFKVKSDFASTMPRTDETEMDYAKFIAARCHEASLPHFNRDAVCQVIEYGSRMADDQAKLSTLFGQLTDLIQEASYWAICENGGKAVEARHVLQALDERRYRSNLYEERTLENIERKVIFIDTTGEVVGQVNGLSVVGLGDYEFAQPSRITARAYMGKEGVVAIEREVEMAGPIHNKGVMTLRGYLGGQYATNQHLALTASITFEQNYGGVEGDSAAASELFALLSALSGYPIKQGLAVTGSVNQLGQIQPIGGVNEKIEGFYEVCKARKLTGDQGVIMPKANVAHLMLRQEVVEAVRKGKFHVYAVDHVDQGIELLTGTPAGERGADGSYPEGTVHYAVQKKIDMLSEKFREWNRIEM